MKAKIFLLIIFCGIVASSINKTFAQQQNSMKENLFIELPRSVTLTPATTGVSTLEVITDKPKPDTHSPYRSFNGTNNNLKKTEWGSADIPLLRDMGAAYGANNSLAGSKRPSPRKISNVVVNEPVTIFNARNVSTVNYLWGQFLDHDISLTPTGNTESAPIPLPDDEPLFTEPISFFRSAVHHGTGVNSVREQTNLNTTWIDASTVYGSDEQRIKWLRTFVNGKLKTSQGNLLPFNTFTGEQNASIDPNAPGMANDGNKTIVTFVAGDVRTAEHPVLASFHTLFMREHNRICDVLVAKGQTDDEKNFQTARKIVGALIQHITYNEYLPSLGISLKPYKGYNDGVRPDLTNIFSTAGFRLGHSMVADEVLLFDNNCQPMDPESLELEDLFWNPQLVVTYKPEAFLKGIAAHTQYETNIKINNTLRNLLFGDPASPVRFGVDLGSLNIQRGRDHGLPDYNAVRKFFKIKAAKKFTEITTDPILAKNLESLYKNINDIDLWVGILSEDVLPGTSIGNLANEIQSKQFENLRDGDFYYYENDPYLSSEDLIAIKNTRLSDIIKRNTTITNLQSDMFFARACPGFTTTPAREATVADVTPELYDDLPPAIFPNPASDVVTVNLNNSVQSGLIQLYTTNGTLEKSITVGASEGEVQIDISDLPKGIHALKIASGKKIKYVKLLKL
jgi:peroxidase